MGEPGLVESPVIEVLVVLGETHIHHILPKTLEDIQGVEVVLSVQVDEDNLLEVGGVGGAVGEHWG